MALFYSKLALLLLAAVAAISSTTSPTAAAFAFSSTPAISSLAPVIAKQKRIEISLHQTTPPQSSGDDDKETPSFLVLGKVVGYRALLGASAVAMSLFALEDAAFFDGTGLDIRVLAKTSEAALPWICGGALLACPLPATITLVQGSARLLGAATILSSVVLDSHTSWTLSMLALMGISVRELWYFGGAYKQECGITLFMLPLMLDKSTSIPFTAPLCALGLGILAGGKLLEPLEEDLVRSNSEFLAKK